MLGNSPDFSRYWQTNSKRVGKEVFKRTKVEDLFTIKFISKLQRFIQYGVCMKINISMAGNYRFQKQTHMYIVT